MDKLSLKDAAAAADDGAVTPDDHIIMSSMVASFKALTLLEPLRESRDVVDVDCCDDSNRKRNMSLCLRVMIVLLVWSTLAPFEASNNLSMYAGEYGFMG